MDTVRALWWVVVWPVVNVAVAVGSQALDIAALAAFYFAPAARPAAFPFLTWAITGAVFQGLVLLVAVVTTVAVYARVPPGE
jgi:hypothetical protein